MFKLTFVSTVLIACLAGCAGQQGSSSPTTEPEPESAEPEWDESELDESELDESELEESELDESELDESESTEVEATEAETTEPEAAPKTSPTRTSCADLTQKTCEITVGCAWSTDKKCVEQGR